MTTVADHIRLLKHVNKQLRHRIELLKMDNHNLSVVNNMLKNNVARDQAVLTAAERVKILEALNQTSEDENKVLREENAVLRKHKQVCEELEDKKNEVQILEEELKKREAIESRVEELEEEFKALME